MNIYLLVVIIIVALSITCGLFALLIKQIIEYNRKKTLVLKYSNYINQMLNINSHYLFVPVTKRKHKITFNAKSKRQFDSISFENIIKNCLYDNYDNLKYDIECVINNTKKYDEYINELNLLEYKIDKNIFDKIDISENDFYKIEQKQFNKLKKRNNFVTSCKIQICYVTPKRRYSYSKKCLLYMNDLIYIYDSWVNNNIYKRNADYERSLMSDSLRYDILRRDNFRCQICGATQADGAKLHVDHIIPVSKGGKTEWNNLRTLCERCNLGKSNKIE